MTFFHQCTYCEPLKKSNTRDDPIFEDCKRLKHQIFTFLETGELRQSTKSPEDSEPKLSDYAEQIMHDHIFKTISDTEEILWYDDRVYRPNAEAIIKSECESLIHDCSRYKVSEVIGIIQRRTLVDRKEFNKDLTKLVFNNGILDLKTGEFNPQHDPGFLTTIKLDYDYNPKAKCPKFLKLLEDCLGDDPKKIVHLIEMMSNVLTMNHKNFETSLIMVGDGANGKSTMLKILRNIFGLDNTSAISIHEIEKEKFSIHLLAGKLANIYADISNAELRTLGKFKQVVSGDPLQVQKKNQGHFFMASFAKHFFSANEMPDIKDNTDGAFRRIQVIRFENEFRSDLGNCIQDYDKIIINEEASGIFNLLFWNYKNIINRGFRFRQSIVDVRNTIKRESDKLREYVETCFVKNLGSYLTTEELYQKYVEYCQFKGYDAHTKQKFTTNLPLYGLNPGSKKIDGKTYRVWFGLEWNFENEWVKSNIQRKTKEEQSTL